MLLTGLHHSPVVSIPLLLPSTSSIFPLHLTPPLLSFTCTRVRGNYHHHGYALTVASALIHQKPIVTLYIERLIQTWVILFKEKFHHATQASSTHTLHKKSSFPSQLRVRGKYNIIIITTTAVFLIITALRQGFRNVNIS